MPPTPWQKRTAIALIFFIVFLPALYSQSGVTRAQAADDRLTLAFYYAWYDENTWTPSLLPDMPVQPYRSRDRATIERHVAQAQAAGIDAFVVSWWGPQEENNQTETNFCTLLDVAQARGFHVTVDFELISPLYASQADVSAALRYLLDTHAQHPAFLRYGGKAVVFFWRQQNYDVATWAALRQQVDPAHTTLWIAEGVDLAYQDVFDGHHLYNITWNPPTDPAYTAAKFRRKIDEYNAAHGTHKLWIATAMPGYDDTRIAGRPGTYVHPRQNGAYYRQTWEAAMASNPDMVIITSFNEWREGTMIEPSATYGDLYLNLTRELSNAYRQGIPLSAITAPTATAVLTATPLPTDTPLPTPTPSPPPTETPSPTTTLVVSPSAPSGVEALRTDPAEPPTASAAPLPASSPTGTPSPSPTATPLPTPAPQPVKGDRDHSGGEVTLTLVGRVFNSQDAPVDKAGVRVFIGDEERKTFYTDTDGFYVVELVLPPSLIEADTAAVEIDKTGYRTTHQGLARREIACAGDCCHVRLPDIVLPRVLNPAFFLATAIFVVVFGLISLNLLHETIAAFLGAAAMLGISYFIGSFSSDFWIIGFHRAISFIDFEVIFLLMTMMIFVAIMSQTGVFQWLAFQTFRLARGNTFLVAAILISITGLISSVLNDTTVMLMMTPVSIQIALALNIHPAAIVVPEVLASNIGGAATFIGTPPNTIIGSYVGLSFNQFLVNMFPIALMSMVILLGMTRWLYRPEFDRESKPPSATLIAKLEAGARITDPILLRKSLLLFSATLILFFVEDLFNMPPAVVAILGSTALLLWVRPNVSEMMREVDWTTLVFFMSLFMMVGGIQEVGLIQLITESVKSVAGDSLLLATLLIIWVSAVASAIVANIPFTTAIVPVTVFLTQTIPGAENNVLYWALALGAGLGGNATYIGSAPNIVAAGIMDRAGFRLKFEDFSRVGVPVTFVTILVPTLWILIRYLWLKF